MTFLGFSGLINFITCVSIAVFVILRNIRSPLNRSFFNLNLSVALYSLGYFLWQSATNEIQALLWFKVLAVGIILINITYLYFVFHFLGIVDKKKSLLRICTFINFVFIVLNLTSQLYSQLEPRYNLGFWPVPTLFFHIYLAFWFWQCFYGFYWLLKGLKLHTGIKKQQIKYFTISAMLGFAGGATNWPMWYGIHFSPYFNITISLYIGIVAYAILRHRLMDIRIAVTRAGIFAFIYTLILGIPFWIGYKYKLWTHSTWIMLILGTAGPFIYQYLRRRAEDVILKEQHRYQRTLRELAEMMARIRDLDRLIQTVTSTVAGAVKLSFACMYVKDDEYKSYILKGCFPKEIQPNFKEFIPFDSPLISTLSKEKRAIGSEELGRLEFFALDSGLIVPCLVGDELLALIVLGPRQRGQLFSLEDVISFETLSYSTSLAIENCQFWREIEERQRQARIEEMDLFSYSLAHEIDNPMSVVLNNARYLKDQFLKFISDEKERQEIESVCDHTYEAAKRVSGMVKAIEEFGKKTTGVFMPLRLEEVMDSYLKLYLPLFKYHGVSFTKELPREIPLVRGVKQEIMQVLAILSNNSIHALQDIKEKHISLKVEIPNPDFIRIAFSDNGYGITREKIQAIFAPFVTTKASTEGKGMGLYNAKRIIQKHKGRIWAESEGKGKGATFFVELSIAKDVTEEELKKEDKGKWVF